MRILKTFFVLAITILSYTTISAQIKAGNNPRQINPASILELESDSQGVLLPRLTTTQRDAQTNWIEGYIIYNSTDSCFQFFDGSIWDCMVGASEISNIVTLPAGSGGGILAGGPNTYVTWSFASTQSTSDQVFKKTSDGGYVLLYNSTEAPYGQKDLIISKLSANMTIEWSRIFGSAHADLGYTIRPTQDGGYILGGSSVGSSPTTNFLFSPESNIDSASIVNTPVGFVLKLDSTGNIQWVSDLAIGSNASTYDIEEIKDGSGYIVAGFLNSTLVSPKIIDLNGNPTGSIPVPAEFLFQTTWGYVLVNGTTITGLNDDFSTRFTSTVNFSVPKGGLAEVPGSSGDFLIYGGFSAVIPSTAGIARLTDQGVIVWQNTFTTPAITIEIEDAIFDNNGDIIAVGDGTVYTATASSSGFKDVIATQISATDGSIINQVAYGGDGIDVAATIEAGQNGQWIIGSAIAPPNHATQHYMSRNLYGFPNNGQLGFMWFFAIDENLLLQNTFFDIEEE